MNIIDLNINSFLIKHSNKQWLKIQQKQEREREREKDYLNDGNDCKMEKCLESLLKD